MNTLLDVINLFMGLIWLATPVVMGIAFLVFIWGITKFIFRAGDEKAVTEGKNLIKWGLIALFVMFSIWGILRFVYGEAGFTRTFGLPLLPQ